MRTSILSILIALTVVIAGPLAFAEQETVAPETLTKTVEVIEMSEVADKMDTEGVKEDCTNSADDDRDTQIDCEDADCAEAPGCKGVY